MRSLGEQFSRHSVALVSLLVALIALGYNTWRNETTEAQRNTRHAAFRVLEALGEVQEVVDYRHYYLPWAEGPGVEAESRLRGYGNVAMVRDLTSLMPAPAPGAGERLFDTWQQAANRLDDIDIDGRHTAEATAAEQQLTATIRDVRAAVLEVLAGLQ